MSTTTPFAHTRPVAPDLPKAREPVYIHRPREAERLRHPLRADEVATFQRDGVLVIRGVFDAEDIQALRAAEEEVLTTRAYLLHPDNMRFEFAEQDGVQVPWKFDPFIDLHPVFGNLMRDRRICDRLCSLFDGYEPRIFKDKYIRKPPGSHGNSIHQDYYMYQGFPTSLLTVAVAIDAATRANGCTQLWPGSHRHGFLHTPGQIHCDIDPRFTAAEPMYLETEPGDICIFSAFTIHAADPNRSEQMRRQVFLTYNDARQGEHYFAHRDHFWAHRCSRFKDRWDSLYHM